MRQFIKKHSKDVVGVLSGLDHVRFRGTFRWFSHVSGMMSFLSQRSVLLKDFNEFVTPLTQQLRADAKRLAQDEGRPHHYLHSSATSKEDLARQNAEEDGVDQGLICLLSCVEPCYSFRIYKNADNGHLELQYRPMKCLHYYFYFLDALLGLLHVRLQTWFPFTMQVCINGREWLCRQLDAAKIGYVRRENCLAWVEDFAAAGRFLKAQVRSNWQRRLDRLAKQCFPLHRQLAGGAPMHYYWSADQTEWATDLVFRSPAALERVYPHLIRHGIQTFSSGDVLRFLGHKTTASGHVHGRFTGEVVSSLKRRPEGVRIKHWVRKNSIKMYDKQGSVLRVETTINDTSDMKVYRRKENEPETHRSWRRLRKGIADLPRRMEISDASNKRYLDTLSAVDTQPPLKAVAEPLSRPVHWHGRQARGLNPLSGHDAQLARAVCRGEFSVNGFRNADLRRLLHSEPSTNDERRRQASKVTRQIRLLRAHGLVRRVTKTHRYLLTKKGRTALVAFLTARETNIQELNNLAA